MKMSRSPIALISQPIADFGMFNYYVIFVASLILMAMFMDVCGISFILPVSTCDLHTTSQQKGIVGGIGLFGMLCSSHLWGFLADTYGRKRVIHPTLLYAFLASFVSSFVTNIYLLALLRFINGIL